MSDKVDESVPHTVPLPRRSAIPANLWNGAQVIHDPASGGVLVFAHGRRQGALRRLTVADGCLRYTRPRTRRCRRRWHRAGRIAALVLRCGNRAQQNQNRDGEYHGANDGANDGAHGAALSRADPSLQRRRRLQVPFTRVGVIIFQKVFRAKLRPCNIWDIDPRRTEIPAVPLRGWPVQRRW
jgi:hypothetical protein